MKETIRIKFKGNDVSLLDSVVKNVVESVSKMGAEVTGPIPLPTKRRVYTILRATHKYSYSKEQFEKRTHLRLVELNKVTSKIMDSLQNFEIASGIEIKIKA